MNDDEYKLDYSISSTFIKFLKSSRQDHRCISSTCSPLPFFLRIQNQLTYQVDRCTVSI